MSLKKYIRLDIIISIILIIGSIFFLRIASEFPVSAALFPKYILIGILILSILTIIESIIKNKHKDISVNKLKDIDFKSILTIITLTVIYYISIEPLGFLISTIIYFNIMSYFLGSNNIIKNLIVSVVFAAFVYGLFITILKVPLPVYPIFI